MTLLALSLIVMGIGCIFGGRDIIKLRRRLEKLEEVISDARPDLLGLPPAQKAPKQRQKCGTCDNLASPSCKSGACVKCCSWYCKKC